MAIQTINLGSAPSGSGGDTQRAANTKINANFTNTQHAASRLVGISGNNVSDNINLKNVLFSNMSIAELPSVAGFPDVNGAVDADVLPVGQIQIYKDFFKQTTTPYKLDNTATRILVTTLASQDRSRFQIALTTNGNMLLRAQYYGDNNGAEMRRDGVSAVWQKMYSTANTTIENGYLKPSSPVLRLSHDGFVKEHEAQQLDIKVSNIKKGVYTITGTTGLRKDDGWYFSPPKDEHMNILCMVEIEEKDDVITVKTYKKKFDFETVSIVPDYDQPIDIVGEVLLRFNDLPNDELTKEA